MQIIFKKVMLNKYYKIMRVVFFLNKKGLFWNKNPTDDITWLPEERPTISPLSRFGYQKCFIYLIISYTHDHFLDLA